MRIARVLSIVTVPLVLIGTVSVAGTTASGSPGDGGDPFAHWTTERVESAIPRDLVIDHRGLGFLRSADGGLVPYGHSVAAAAAPLRSGAVAGALPAPGRATDLSPATNAVSIELSPSGNETIGAQATFTARVVVPGGAKQVSALVGTAGTSSFQRFRMSYTGTDAGAEIWQLSLSGFSTGDWEWYIEAKDSGPKGGATHTSAIAAFNVNTGGTSGITSERWIDGGAVQTAAGRILFTMSNRDYVCSGTAVTDNTAGRSVVLTAAHCIYDDVAKAFSSNAIFIPSQDDGGLDGTDSNCSNDLLGCWAVDHGVVDLNWTTRTFPDNIPWDYGFYVVSDSGAHQGTASNDALDVAAGALTIDFTSPEVGQDTTALGYSYSDDPKFMYCQEGMGTNGTTNYWLDSCDLSGGSSGGPWLQPVSAGNGPVISVNSWGYTTRAGMAGPKLHDNSAQLLLVAARDSDMTSTDRGFVIDPTPTPDPDGISLNVLAYKQQGTKTGDLTWSGADTTNVDIYYNGVNAVTTPNDGSYTHTTGEKGGGTSTWKICEEGTSNCSPIITVSW